MAHAPAGLQDRPGAATPTPSLIVLADRLAAGREDLARRMVARYREQIPDYRLADDEHVLADVLEVSLHSIDLLVESLRSDRPTDPDAFAGTRSNVARRVRQGISLESFLHAARLWGEVLWEAVLESADPEVPEQREAALAIAGRVIRHIDLLSTHAAEGYLSEAQGIWTEREVVRRDLLDGLVAGQGDTDRVRRLARSLRLRLAEDYLVVVARVDEPAAQPGEPPEPAPPDPALRRIVEAARRHLCGAAGPVLVGVRHGEVVALCPGAAPADADRVKLGAAALAAELGPSGVRVGVGGAHPGLADVATSYEEAREAVEIAVQADVRGRAVLFDDVLIDHMVRSSPHADRILDTSLRPLLEYDEARQAELVPTLRTYVAEGFNLARSAERLCVHPNTVAYRLRRIRDLCGRDPHDPGDLLLLVLGLRLADLRGAG